MFASIIIPTYKDIVALKLILEALEYQTYKKFEVIIAEDDDSKEVQEMLKNYDSKYKIRHFSHKNSGNRKAIIMNKALSHANGEYIIFIDGDTIPYSTFIESHILLSEKKIVLCGRRVNLGDKVSRELRERKISAKSIEDNYIKFYNYIRSDNSRHYEQGIRLHPQSLLYKLVNITSKNLHILASNFSCFKEEIFAVNGFDEDLPYAPNRDDTDLEWRMIANGCKMKSCKYTANLLHLNHSRINREEEGNINLELINEKKVRNEYVAKKGIV